MQHIPAEQRYISGLTLSASEATIAEVKRRMIAFRAELAEAVTRLAARYHDASAPGGRPHRLVVLAHPLPRDAATTPSPEPPLSPAPDEGSP